MRAGIQLSRSRLSLWRTLTTVVFTCAFYSLRHMPAKFCTFKAFKEHWCWTTEFLWIRFSKSVTLLLVIAVMDCQLMCRLMCRLLSADLSADLSLVTVKWFSMELGMVYIFEKLFKSYSFIFCIENNIWCDYTVCLRVFSLWNYIWVIWPTQHLMCQVLQNKLIML